MILGSTLPRTSNTKLLLDKLEKGGKYTVFGFSRPEKLMLVEELDQQVVYIAQNQQDAISIQNKLQKSASTLLPFLFPTGSDTNSVYSENYQKILDFKNGTTQVLIIYPELITNYFIGRVDSLTFTVDEDINREHLISKLRELGYTRVESVSGVNEFSLRGETLDIFVEKENCILRVHFFDTCIEKITKYSPFTFEKLEGVDEYTLFSNTFLPVKNQTFFENILTQVKKAQSKTKDIEQLENLRILENMVDGDKELSHITHQDWYLPFLEGVSLFDFLSDALFIFDEHKIIYDSLQVFLKQSIQTVSEMIALGQYLDNHKKFLLSIESIKKSLENCNVLAFGNISSNNRFFASNAVFHITTIPVSNYFNRWDNLVEDAIPYLRQGYEILIFASNDEWASRLAKRFEAKRVGYEIIKNLSSYQAGMVHILTKEYPYSFGLLNEKVMCYGTDCLIERQKRVVQKQDLDIFTDLPKVGDFVVHSTYGIARYDGNIMLQNDNGQKEYLVLKYKNDDTVYLPVENLDRLTKFVGEKEAPQLSKLGGGEFLKVKAKVKSGLKDLAFSLVQLYKARQNSHGVIYPRDVETEKLLNENFAYTLTPDQEKAIHDVYEDMASGKIMDRLICGDVGYGKTEVAIRTILKTVMNGYQVAFLCPTTILSEQHYHTCMERLANFGVRIGVLNRFKSKKEQTEILNSLKDGKIDVLIGTHRILSQDVVFAKLGLLVLDEEQKFGVGDKEKIKNLKKDINVLTLSATPIPRTLHMSLIGVRDISTIAMPPLSRKDCITQVVEYSDEVVKTAIDRELHRGGQILIVYNHVQSMTSMYEKIRQLAPNDVRIGMAHGQMEEKELENIILKLYQKELDILIASTLIENGIDLPNANTLVVIDSQMLGLSQLYQLKGRVGRSDRQAYAYFTYQKDKLFNSNAYKRLEAIGEYSALGSGYKIALRDLEIRGAGNILGVEQSGHMGKVGYHLYMTLLQEAVEEIQNGKYRGNVDTQVVTTLDAYLPESYIASSAERISVYTSIAKLQTKEAMIQEKNKMLERYSFCPEEVENLMKVATLKNIASNLGITKVVVRPSTSYFEFDTSSNYDIILQLVDKNKSIFSLDMSSRPKVVINLNGELKDKIVLITQVLEEFLQVCA